MTARAWSEQQVAIFDWFARGEGNLVVRARAGTGKTTTILEAVSRAPERTILLAAFNKRIADELKGRLSTDRCEAKTLHSLGFAFIRRHWKGVRVDSNRGFRLAKAAAGDQSPDEILGMVAKLASVAKGVAPLAKSGEELVDLAFAFDCAPDEEWEDDGWTVERVAAAAHRAIELACEPDGTIDFDDMLAVPLRCRMTRAWYDLVVVDEAQDMNYAQLLLAEKARRRGGRLAVVGDDRQAIYGFRGADRGSLDRLKAAFEAVELGLTVTYRCGSTIVAEAKKLVPDFAAAPTNGPGVVRKATEAAAEEELRPGDYLLSRVNAPLAAWCLRLLRRGVRARIEGRDVSAGLRRLLKKTAVGPARNDLGLVLDRLDAHAEREATRAGHHEAAQKRAARLRDQVETIRVLAEGLTTVGELLARLDELFAEGPDAGPRVVCSSVHRSKGLEADRVFVLEDTLPTKWPKIPATFDASEEANIEYVAITRARSELVWVKG